MIIDPATNGDTLPGGLSLTVGCEFQVESSQPLAAVLQVAPCPQAGVRVRREQWDTGCDHHGYVDLYQNRCERFAISAGSSRIAYEAELVLSDPADVIEPGAAETPVAALPDEVLSFVMRAASACPTSSAMKPGSGSVT